MRYHCPRGGSSGGGASESRVRFCRSWPWPAGEDACPAADSDGTTPDLGAGTAGIVETGRPVSDMDIRRSDALGPSALSDGAATLRRMVGLIDALLVPRTAVKLLVVVISVLSASGGPAVARVRPS